MASIIYAEDNVTVNGTVLLMSAITIFFLLISHFIKFNKCQIYGLVYSYYYLILFFSFKHVFVVNRLMIKRMIL
jgi:hypothetical protein